MKKIVFTFFIACLTIVVYAQEVTVRQANLERRKYKSGVMLLYYGQNRLVQNVSLYTVDFKNEDSEERIAGILKERYKTPVPYMYFEFKEGYDCRNAQSYLTGKGINKMAFGNCLDVSFKENPEGKYVQPGGLNYWENPANVTETRVVQLSTYAWALVNRILEKRQEELEKNGWERMYAEYNLAGGSKDNLWVGKRISASPDSTYMAIATVMSTSFKLRAINADKMDAEGNPTFVFDREFGEDKLAETVTFHPTEQISRFIFAGVSNDRINTNNAGILIYRKKYSIADEFQAVLDDAKNNFINYKLSETKDPNGVPVFKATKVFGLKSQMIFQVKETGNWMYCQFCNTDDPNAEAIKKSITDIINSYVKTGNYLTESGEHEGDMLYRLMDKQKNILFQMGVGDKKISLNFFGSRENNNETKPESTSQTTNTKQEAGNPTQTSSPVTEPFINPKKDYIFQNWTWAKITFKWSWLETPGNDPNVSRDFLDLSDKTGNNKDNVILRIKQKTSGYTWAMATPNVGKFSTYTYAAEMGLAKAEGSEFGQGLMILLKEGRKGDFTRLYFLIDPVRQTYWFGSQNPNSNQWITHNHYTGDTYNIFSTAINKHVNDGKTITKNTVAIEKQNDKILLYINNQLVDTVEITKKNEWLNNFEGIGIVTVDKQLSTVDKLSFSK